MKTEEETCVLRSVLLVTTAVLPSLGGAADAGKTHHDKCADSTKGQQTPINFCPLSSQRVATMVKKRKTEHKEGRTKTSNGRMNTNNGY